MFVVNIAIDIEYDRVSLTIYQLCINYTAIFIKPEIIDWYTYIFPTPIAILPGIIASPSLHRIIHKFTDLSNQ